MKKYILLSLLLACTLVEANSQTLTVSTFTTGLTRPVSITNTGLPNDNRIFVCEKIGRIRLVDRNTGTLNPTPFLNISSLVYSTGNEQGLLGLAFHPNYASNGFFYVFYNHRVGSINYTRLARYQVSAFADSAMINSGQVMMTVYHPFANHNGGNLMFGRDGYLYVSMGDGGSSGDPSNRAQNCDSLLGKILRLDVSNPNPPYYYSPASNPFFNGHIPSQPYLGTIPGRDEVYAWGMRNPWRCSIDRLTGDKWIADVGQNAWEEIDFESRADSFGHNYGWRCYEGNAGYNTGGCQPASSFTSPIFTYPQGSDCSVTGGYVYRGGKEGSMFGKYFFADYCSGKIWKTQPNGTGWTTTLVPQTNALFTNKFTAWGEDIYGELYLAGDGSSGVLYKIIDTSCAPTAYIHQPDTLFNCAGNPITIQAVYGTGLNYNWFVDGVSVFNSNSGSFTYTYNSGCHNVYVIVTGLCSATSNTITVCSGTSYLPPVSTTA
ncbi:MAG TPA: PQQ-dependent sugar dehydrogenase, partial [Chitinophagaceae bacterium]|nr:PQQ-dependent sugar dehydrogenase [Chitinophagaceae bacterium]